MLAHLCKYATHAINTGLGRKPTSLIWKTDVRSSNSKVSGLCSTTSLQSSSSQVGCEVCRARVDKQAQKTETNWLPERGHPEPSKKNNKALQTPTPQETLGEDGSTEVTPLPFRTIVESQLARTLNFQSASQIVNP